MTALTIRSSQLKLLERLCNAVAVSGDEGEVRKIVLEQVTPHADEVRVDALGNVLVTRRGSGRNRLKVMLASHMDEVGLMVVSDEGEGVYRFAAVGGTKAEQLVGKLMLISKDHIPAVIGTRPVHLQEDDDLKRDIPLEQLRLDVGAPGANIKIGDRATFATRFRRVGPSIMAKALDDRLGVATLIELLRHAPANIDLQLAFTVQEEVALRGAGPAAHAFAPDLAIAVECTLARDLPTSDGRENTVYNTKLGLGPAIYIADSSTLQDKRLVRHFEQTGRDTGIPCQIRQPGGGGNDAGAIHQRLEGIPSLSIAVPGRYIHTPISICRVEDWQNTLRLVHAGLSRVTPALLKR
jgi:endoglucanase